jgi:hypothetical protein
LVSTPASPNVHLPSATVAIVAADRSCHLLANTLAERITREAIFRVDPKAKVRLLVTECSNRILPTVNIFKNADSRTGTSIEERKVVLDGRGYAQVEVTMEDQSQAFLIGSSRWAQETSRPRAIRGITQQLRTLVADDILEQVRPIPRMAERRIFPNAQPGSHKALLTEAVAAEIRGDLTRAIELASAAQKTAPNARIQAYIDDLNQQFLRR